MTTHRRFSYSTAATLIIALAACTSNVAEAKTALIRDTGDGFEVTYQSESYSLSHDWGSYRARPLGYAPRWNYWQRRYAAFGPPHAWVPPLRYVYYAGLARLYW